MAKGIFENIKTNTFPQNLDEMHLNMKEGILTSVFNGSLNPIMLKTDMSDTFFDMLKSNISLGLSGPQIEMYGDYYFTSFIFGTKFIPIKPPPGYLLPCIMSQIGPVGTFKSLISTVVDDKSQEDLMNRYIVGLMTQKSIELGSIISPVGVIIPGPPLSLPLLVKPKRKKKRSTDELLGSS